jgi:SAM-dependent methyltransferase
MTAAGQTSKTSAASPVNVQIRRLDNDELFRAVQRVYEVPSLAAWRCAELKILRNLEFPSPILDLGCGGGLFSRLLFRRVECGIDRNPRSVALCANQTGIYDEVRRMDARSLQFGSGSFATVFANCVIEHVPNLPSLLSECRRVLCPGGRMVATVPLKNLDRHLVLHKEWYARARAWQLQHVNLLDEAAWVQAFKTAGFSHVNTIPYIYADFCGKWDRVDAWMCLGVRSLSCATAYRLLRRVLPRQIRESLDQMWRRYFALTLFSEVSNEPCAILIVADAS